MSHPGARRSVLPRSSDWATKEPGGRDMSTESNKAVVRRIGDEFWNQGRVEVLEEVFAADVIDHYPAPGQPAGRDGVVALNVGFRRAFPDMRMTVDDVIAEGDRIAWRWTAQGTHQGELMGIPATGKPATVHGVSVDRFMDDRIVERWLNLDMLGLLQQIGAIPVGH